MFWPGEFHGLYSPRGCQESDTTETLTFKPPGLQTAGIGGYFAFHSGFGKYLKVTTLCFRSKCLYLGYEHRLMTNTDRTLDRSGEGKVTAGPQTASPVSRESSPTPAAPKDNAGGHLLCHSGSYNARAPRLSGVSPEETPHSTRGAESSANCRAVRGGAVSPRGSQRGTRPGS